MDNSRLLTIFLTALICTRLTPPLPGAETAATTIVGVSDPALPEAVTDLWVDADGTAWLLAPDSRNNTGGSLLVRRDNRWSVFADGVGGLVLSGNRDSLFVGTEDGVRIFSRAAAGADASNDLIPINSVLDDTMEARQLRPDGISVRGLASSERYLFVSNATRQRLEKWDIAQREKVADWPFPRPGAICFSEEDGLWVIRERQLLPEVNPLTRNWQPLRQTDVLAPAAVVRIDPETGSLLEQLDDAEEPIALTLHPTCANGSPALLVADNGPNQQILVYSRRNPRRSQLRRPLGNIHGFLGPAGSAATDRKFNGLVGLGVAGDGSLFVAQNWNVLSRRRARYPSQAVEILCFSPGLDQLAWSSCRLTGALPATAEVEPPHDIHVRNMRLAMDWGKQPDEVWSLGGRTTDPLVYPHDPAFMADLAQPAARLVLGREMLFGVEGDKLLFFRRDRVQHGEVWIPNGAVIPLDDSDSNGAERSVTAPGGKVIDSTEAWLARAGSVRRGLSDDREAAAARAGKFGWFWIDGRGADPLDGKIQLDETESLGAAWQEPVWSVDASGAIWLTGRPLDGGSSGPAAITSWHPDRLSPLRLPLYRTGMRRSLPQPLADGVVNWHHYLPDANLMLFAGHAPLVPGRRLRLVCGYADWISLHTYNPRQIPRWMVLLPSLSAQAPEVGGEAVAEKFTDVQALDVADGLLFALQPSPLLVGVYDLERGNCLTVLRPEKVGEESNSGDLRGRERAGLSVFRRENGEFVILVPDLAKDRLLMLRWQRPEKATGVPQVAPEVEGFIYADHIRLIWTTPAVGPIQGYRVYRTAVGGEPAESLTSDPLEVAYYRDCDTVPGQLFEYRVSVVNELGEGPLSAPVRLVPAAATARFVGEDRETLGQWKGRYGSWGYWLFGDQQDRAAAANPRLPAWLGGLADHAALRQEGRRQLDLRQDGALPQRALDGREAEHVAGGLACDDTALCSLPIEVQDGRAVRMSIYCGSSEFIYGVRIEIVDAESGRLLDAREVCNEEDTSVRGCYLTWDLTGNTLLRLMAPRDSEAPDICGINAIFFDPSTTLADEEK